MSMIDSLADRLGVYDSTVSDAVVAGRIQQCVSGQYSQVNVETKEYTFGQGFERLRSRVVTVSMTGAEVLRRRSSGGLDEARPDLNSTRIVRAVLGSGKQEDVAELRKAAQGLFNISIEMALNRGCIHQALRPIRS